MSQDDNPASWGKYLVISIGAGIVSALACVAAQRLIVGEVSPAITGGIAGAVAVVATMPLRRSRRACDGK